MNQRQLHDRIRRAFGALTRPPRPELSERIRDSLWGRQVSEAAPFSLPLPPAATIAVVVILVLLAGMVREGPTVIRLAGGASAGVSRLLAPPRTASTPAPRATRASARPSAALNPSPSAPPSPSATPSETPAPTAPAPPTPVPATLPGYSCSAQSGGGGQATMTTARAGVQSGYDRFVIQFTGGVPQYDVTPQDSAAFAQSGGSVTLAGSAGLMVVLHGASGAGAFSGQTDLQPGFAEIKEAKLLGDSQGVVEWGIGIGRFACFRAWTLPGPPRLIIDIASG